MEVLRDVYGYEYRSTRRGFEVLPRRLRTRVFEVDYLNMRREGSSQTRVSSGQVTQTADQTTENSGDDNEVDRGPRRSTNDRASRVTGTEINTIQPETSFWGEIYTSVKAILGGAEGRKVVVNRQSGMVVVRAMPNELREVEEFLIATQAVARRQVILEAKIIEVRLDDGFQQGINWAAMLEPGDGKSVTVGQVGRGSIIRNDNTLVPARPGNLDPRNFLPLLGPAAGAVGGIFTVALALSDFNAFVQILDTQGTVHVLSNPRIATLNNQKAVIKVGSDEFFVTDISNTIVAGVSTTTTPSVELTPFFSGIALDVTPQISADGEVLLHIHPAISRVQDQQKIVTLGEVTQSIPLALSTVRESDSVVRARSGQVVVIGGLMESISEDEVSDSPVSAAPVVGGLFSDKRERLAKSELVILLRPLIVENGRQWTEAIQQSSNTIEDLDRAAGQPGRWGQRRD
jgi:MSHA biogenesis protein MshL